MKLANTVVPPPGDPPRTETKTETMRAIVKDDYGSTEVLRVEEVNTPVVPDIGAFAEYVCATEAAFFKCPLAINSVDV